MVQGTEPLTVVPLTIDEFRDPEEVAEVTTALGLDCAEAEPELFDPVILTASVEPTSAEASSAYVCEVAPGIAVQLLPPELQRFH